MLSVSFHQDYSLTKVNLCISQMFLKAAYLAQAAIMQDLPASRQCWAKPPLKDPEEDLRHVGVIIILNTF